MCGGVTNAKPADEEVQGIIEKVDAIFYQIKQLLVFIFILWLV